jgi:hypothetical protein|tara:strand:+ start:7874 stop:8380 length:507 start_codon:yes stop_codon:yes gene_type:complete
MPETFDRSAAARPHDKWFNGNMKLQVENGTFEDCRALNEEHLRGKKITKEEYAKWCKEWDAMPMEEKVARYKALEEETTPRPFKLPNGKTVMVSEPSDNGHVRRQKKNQKKQSLRTKRPAGSVDFEGSALAKAAAKAASENPGPSGPESAAAPPPSAPQGAERVPVAA